LILLLGSETLEAVTGDIKDISPLWAAAVQLPFRFFLSEKRLENNFQFCNCFFPDSAQIASYSTYGHRRFFSYI